GKLHLSQPVVGDPHRQGRFLQSRGVLQAAAADRQDARRHQRKNAQRNQDFQQCEAALCLHCSTTSTRGRREPSLDICRRRPSAWVSASSRRNGLSSPLDRISSCGTTTGSAPSSSAASLASSSSSSSSTRAAASCRASPSSSKLSLAQPGSRCGALPTGFQRACCSSKRRT